MGSQHLVAVHELGKAGFERGDIELARQSNGSGSVKGRIARIQLVEQP